MSPGTFVILSGLLTFGIPLILAVRELFYLRPGGGWRPDPPAPVGPKPLPDCLIPKPMVRVRQPELVD